MSGTGTLLLDVNVLLALAWPNHQFHATAVQRFDGSTEPWATCALTQLGFLRVSSNPRAVGLTKSPAEAAAILEALVRDPQHVYLEALPSPVAEKFRLSLEQILGYQQVTDAYLLALAAYHNASLLTFDGRLQELAKGGGSVEVLALP